VLKDLTQPEEVKQENVEKAADMVTAVKDVVKDKVGMAKEELSKDNNSAMGPYEVPGMAGTSGFDPISAGLAFEMDKEDLDQKKSGKGDEGGSD